MYLNALCCPPFCTNLFLTLSFELNYLGCPDLYVLKVKAFDGEIYFDI